MSGLMPTSAMLAALTLIPLIRQSDAISRGVWAASWGSVPTGCSNLEPMVWLPGEFHPGASSESVDGEALARQLMQHPRGRRVLLVNRYCHSFWGYQPDLIKGDLVAPLAGPWADSVLPEITKDWPQILRIVKACGGTIDYLACDFEEWGNFTTWNLTDAQITAIRSDSRWSLSHFGAPSMREMMSSFSELSASDIKDARQDAYLRWNYAIGRTTVAYMNKAVWSPAVTAFPSVIGSNYRGWTTPPDPAPCGNGHLQPEDNVLGNAVSPSLYGEIESLVSRYIDPINPTLMIRQPVAGAVAFTRGPWQSFLVAQQQARAAVRGSRGRPFLPWVAHASYDGTPSGKGFVGFPVDLRCYDEHIRHTILLGAQVLLWWRNPTDHPEPDAYRLNQIISDSNEHCLGRILKPVSLESVSFLAHSVLSGAQRVDGKWIWRISVSPRVYEVKDAKTGERIEIPQGTLGVWKMTDTADPPNIVVKVAE